MPKEQPEPMNEEHKPRSYRFLGWVLPAVAVIAIVFWMTDGFSSVAGGTANYQAVFLTNDQVYFGKLSRPNGEYPVLREVYYLQVTQTLQPKDANAPATNINLVKLGGELHGPSDAMYLNHDQILFYEDLKSDSQVVKAIEQYRADQGGK